MSLITALLHYVAEDATDRECGLRPNR